MKIAIALLLTLVFFLEVGVSKEAASVEFTVIPVPIYDGEGNASFGMLEENAASLKKYPPIPAGALDPYEPKH